MPAHTWALVLAPSEWVSMCVDGWRGVGAVPSVCKHPALGPCTLLHAAVSSRSFCVALLCAVYCVRCGLAGGFYTFTSGLFVNLMYLFAIGVANTNRITANGGR